MPFRVREILLVSSAYDAFILEEDGPLTEKIFYKYSELNLSWAPRITHVGSGARALELLSTRRFDLVLVMPRLEDINVTTFCLMIKQQDPALPVVLLTFSEAELQRIPADAKGIDYTFLWTGDTRILIAINKLVEDRKNIAHDTEQVGIPVIIVVEDNVRSYSTFLAELYSELMLQSRSLASEGVNNLNMLLRMRSRPKVVLARSYEDAIVYYNRFEDRVLAVISDVRFPTAGGLDPEAGFKLVAEIRAERPDLPVLLQSADAESGQRAAELGLMWVNKRDPNLLRIIRTFMQINLGFGDFVFRHPDGSEIAHARDLVEMEQLLKTVPIESFVFHAQRNDFSVWLTARSMFDLANTLRPKRLADFGSVEDGRQFVINMLRATRLREQHGLITDFTSRELSPDSLFVRLGEGSIGGKARGIAFSSFVLVNEDMLDRFEGFEIRVPKSVVIGADVFDRFIEHNRIRDDLPALTTDSQLISRFLDGSLSEEFMYNLAQIWPNLSGPVAVRSSSLLEDLQFQPFSGVYATYMLPNNHPDPNQRLQEVYRAIKAVYASTYSQNARTYIAGTSFRIEEEKMAVVIQEMVGQEHHGRFYPHISGVARSYNYYPVEGQKPEDGTALVALGLGQIVVTGGACLRFAPRSPSILPQFQKPADFLRLSQKRFYAVDMTQKEVDFRAGPESSLKTFDLAAAEEDGTLAAVGSVFSAEDNTIRDTLMVQGPRVVTFNNILKWQSVPLAASLDELLRVLGRGLGCAVEVEFAVDMGDWGKPATAEARPPTLHILQIRPASSPVLTQSVELAEAPSDEIFIRTDQALGHGVHTDVRDVVYVKPGTVDGLPGKAVAEEVGQVNAALREQGVGFVLIGPGRWGSSDPRLGIPVEWRHIAGARVIAETPLKDRRVEPSQGTHFFQNITSLGVGYLTLTRVSRDGQSFVDLDWLDRQPAVRETAAVRHVRFEHPLAIYLDGRRGTATILKPKPEPGRE